MHREFTRSKKLIANTATSFVYQIVTVISGMILPRFYLVYFGSATNGLVSSITQFLGFITFCELGVGAVIQSSLYKPLADKNTEEVSKIVVSSERFFRRIAIILVLYILVLCFVYPHFKNIEFEPLFTISLIVIIAISSFAQYFFGATYRLLLNADQMGFIQFGLRSLAVIINVLISLILMKAGFGIHIVRLASSTIFLLQPIVVNLYCRKRYIIIRNIKIEGEPIKQKWNGIAQHIAYVVLQNTDVAILTLFSTLENVSIYGIYLLTVNGIRLVIESLSGGVESVFGNMIAKGEETSLRKFFSLFEWGIHSVVTVFFSILALLIVPFVKLYTRGINDANYVAPIFGAVLSLAYAFYCLQIPYNLLVHAAGHYKQTQMSSIIEASINIIISILAVIKYQLVGVAIGTFCAMCFRSVYLSVYISNNIIQRSKSRFAILLLYDILCGVFIFLLTNIIIINITSFLVLILYAAFLVILSLLFSLAASYIFNRPLLLDFLYMIREKVSKKI